MPNPSWKNGFLSVPGNAKIHTISEPESNLGKFKRKFATWSCSTSAMFVKPTLSVGDIHQGQIGDCWFLAGAAAIIQKPFGSDAIKRTVIDCEDGWCIVRLYDGDLNPVYIRTRKTRASFLGSKYGVTGTTGTGFWTTALEKAAACFKGPNRTEIDVENPSLKNTESGFADQSFRMLLGSEVTRIAITNAEQGGSADAERTFSILTSNWSTEVPANATQLLQTVFGGGVSVQDWKTHRARARQELSLLRVGQPVASQVPANIMDGLKAYVERHGLWSQSGHVGSGTYSGKTLDLFQTISTKLAADCPIGFVTRKEVGKSEGRGKSAGETMSKGMVGTHVYAILDVFSETVLARRKFIKACNPWGSYGRGYSDSDNSGAPKLDPKEQSGGVFWMELSDFASLATSLSIGTPVPRQENMQWTVNPLFGT